MVESVGFVCQNYSTAFMMICEHLRRNICLYVVGGIYGCVMGLNFGKLKGTNKLWLYLGSFI